MARPRASSLGRWRAAMRPDLGHRRLGQGRHRPARLAERRPSGPTVAADGRLLASESPAASRARLVAERQPADRPRPQAPPADDRERSPPISAMHRDDVEQRDRRVGPAASPKAPYDAATPSTARGEQRQAGDQGQRQLAEARRAAVGGRQVVDAWRSGRAPIARANAA